MAKRRIRWGRILGLLIVVGLVAAGVKMLTAEVPEAAPHARAEPRFDALPKMTICWVEGSHGEVLGQLGTAGWTRTQTWRNTASAILVRHPKGDVLIDAAYSSNALEEFEELPFLGRVFSTIGRKGSVDFVAMPDAVRKAGADPAAIAMFIPSHAHNDHVGGLVDLPPQNVRLPRAEMDLVAAGAPRVMTAHQKAMEGRMTPIAFARAPYENFDESWDVFGDGAIVVAPLPGHTPGSVATFVNLSKDKRLVHVGDTVNLVESVERRLPKSTLLSLLTDSDAKGAQESLAKLSQLRAMTPGLQMLPAHDRDAWLAFFGQPFACVAAP